MIGLIALALTSGVVPSPLGHAEDASTPGLSIPVVVTYADGAPVPRATVGVMWRETESRVHGQYKADAQGRVQVPARQPGLYHLYVLGAPGLDPGWLRRSVYTSLTPVEIGYDSPGEPVVLVAPKAGTLVVELDRGNLPPRDNMDLVGVSLKRFYPNGALSGAHDSRKPGIERLDPEGRRWRITYGRLPEGRYRAKTIERGGCTNSFVDALVSNGETTTVSLAVGPPAEPVQLDWSGPVVERTGKANFNVNCYAGSGSLDIDWGPFDGPSTSFVSRALRPGKYLLICWDLDLAMALAVPAASGSPIEVRPPEEFLHPSGEYSLTVELSLDGVPCREFPILVAPSRGRGLTEGDWFWMQDSQAPNPFVFRGLKPGVYDVMLPDGGFGLTVGFEPKVIVRRVKISDHDEAIRIDL
ncbi:MAG: hypothetical protein KDB73_17310 [Planctomycetes bacterium]|nr:hypothetical protein [Planctomycetota bacterium]